MIRKLLALTIPILLAPAPLVAQQQVTGQTVQYCLIKVDDMMWSGRRTYYPDGRYHLSLNGEFDAFWKGSPGNGEIIITGFSGQEIRRGTFYTVNGKLYLQNSGGTIYYAKSC